MTATTATPTHRRRPGFLGPVHITQLLLAELVLVALLATLPRGVVFVGVAAAVGAIALLVTFARRGTRWWLERRVMAWRYRQRRRHADAAGHDTDPRLALLRRLAPGLVIHNVRLADGDQVGVGRDDAGWFAVAALDDTTMLSHPTVLPLPALAAALAEAGQPGAVLQVVIQAVPAPGTTPSGPADDSYRQLMATFGPTPVPTVRNVWVAVRLDARSLAESLAGQPTDSDPASDLDNAPAVVAALIRRVTKSIRPLGLAPHLLDADEVLTALMWSCDLGSPPATSPAVPRETWTSWRSARFSQRCYWIRQWPPLDTSAAMLASLFAAPAAMTTVSLTLAPDDERIMDLKALVRLAAPAAQLDGACRSLVRAARSAQAVLLKLDGEHSLAVYASAPTGGGAR